MTPVGFPDFAAALPDGAFRVLLPYGSEAAPAWLLPDALDIARDSSGTPVMRLTIVRPQNPMLPPEPHALFDMQIRPLYRFDEGIEILRARCRQGRLEPIPFRGGTLRFIPQADAAGFPDEIMQPSPLAWNGLAGARYGVRLGIEGGAFVRRMLEEGVMPVAVRAEMEIAGVGVRVPHRVAFDPADVAAALTERADAEGLIKRGDLVALLESSPGSLPFTPDRAPDDPRAYARAIVDRIRARLASFAASPARPPAADGASARATYMRLAPEAAASGHGRTQWDLAEAEVTFRPWILEMNPLDAVRATIQTAGIGSIAPPPVIVPSLSLGMHTVVITANLPENRPGVPAVGVTLIAPPAPPARPQAQIASAEFEPPDDMASVTLRLSPSEPLAYRWRTFVMIEEEAGPRRIDGQEFAGEGSRLRLSVDDFPVRFLVVEADGDLLAVAAITGRCVWATGEIPFAIQDDSTATTIPVPRDAGNPAIEVHARARDGVGILTLGPEPARSIHVGFPSFREHGPHVVTVEAAFADAEPSGPDAEGLVAVEMVADGREGDANAVSVLALTRGQSRKEWRYLATSIFRAGFRYRIRGGSGDGAAVPPWSESRSPFEPLRIDASVPSARRTG